MLNISEPIKTGLDWLAALVSVVSFLTTLLPALASLVTLTWGCIRIWEWYKSKKGTDNVHEQLNRLDS